MTEGYEVYAELVDKLVDAEAARRTTLEQKASAVITTSGTLVTLLFGLVAVLTPYGETNLTVDELAGMWSDPIIQARAAVAGVRLQALETSRRRNTEKARMLIAAMGIEVVAVIVLAIAVAIMLNSSLPA
jgi:hypothetical protein